jgi:acyl carrier protein
MEERDVISLVEEILEVDPGTVSMTDALDDIDWDSLSNISFIAEIDSRLGVSINADQLSKAATVADLYALVQDAAQRG